MDFSQVKMVVTDMDGTLLNSNHEVSDRFFELFGALKKRDILFVAASGRQYNSIVDKLHSIKDEILVIAENGGYVVQQEKELLATPLGKEKRTKILQTLQDIPNIHPVLCGKRSAYLSNPSDTFIQLLRQYYSGFEIVEDLNQVDAEILKVAIYHFESSEDFIYPAVKHLEGDLKVKVSGANWVDISSPNANKGFALEKMQERFSISPEETMVFGDYNNDLEMLGKAKYSFAMENAHPNVLKVANYQTTSNDDFGVERVLEQLLKS
jgi:Cof subfamily protein (haloacid dehalogenase superfamily)